MYRILAVAFGLLLFAALPAQARPQALSVAEWRADLAELDEAVRRHHPRPFAHVEEETYAAAVSRLSRDIPRLGDQEIVLRLAEIVGLFQDGHTRLALPRQHPEIGLEFGHVKTEPPSETALHFAQLPVAFEKFEDGLFIVAAEASRRDLVGSKLVSIGGMDAGAALEAVRKYAPGENDALAGLIGADLLSLPAALRGAGVIKREERAELVLSRDGAERAVDLAPMPAGPVDWVEAASSARSGGAEQKLSYEFLPGINAVHATITEVADAGPAFAAFSARIIDEANARDARLVIDLRDNFGGDADLNRSLVLALIGDARLNRSGQLFVLIGPRTFSAAQLLVNHLERYTRAFFVGSGTGARPDHYGDSRRTRLKNSELTLRVSSVHWSSLIGLDARKTTGADFPAPMTSTDYFSGSDPALALIGEMTGPPPLRDLVAAALERGDQYQVYRYLADVRLDARTHDRDLSGDLLAAGEGLAARGLIEPARYAYRYGLFYYPDDRRLQEALAKLPAP